LDSQFAEKVKVEVRKRTLDFFKSDKKFIPNEFAKREKGLEESKTVRTIIQSQYDSNNVAIQASIDLYRSWHSF
jgi:hypothetical protein